MAPSTYPQQRPDVETHLLPDGTCLLFDPQRDEGYALNAAGALVWDYCDGTLTGEEIAQELESLLPEHSELREETATLLAELTERGLLLPSGATTAPNASEDQQ